MKIILEFLEFFFVPLSIKNTPNNCSSPHNGPRKKSITKNEIQNSNSGAKKIIILVYL